MTKDPFPIDFSKQVIEPTRPGVPIPNDQDIDIVMTHGPLYDHLDKTHDRLNVGCPQLLQAIERVRPRLHCFGHIHEVSELIPH
jgi:Icc-related predicted phosphoesterase